MCAALWTRGLDHGLPGTTPGAAVPPATRGLDALPRNGAGTASRRVWLAEGDSPFGVLRVAASEAGLCAVGLAEEGTHFAARVARAGWQVAAADDAPPPALVSDLLAAALAQLDEYFAGERREFDLPLDLRAATAFDRRVLAAMAAIPYGQTRTYAGLARAIGSPGAARAVGHACGRNPLPLLLPCHRVVRSDGSLAGYGAGGPEVKAALLALEGRGLPC